MSQAWRQHTSFPLAGPYLTRRQTGGKGSLTEVQRRTEWILVESQHFLLQVQRGVGPTLGGTKAYIIGGRGTSLMKRIQNHKYKRSRDLEIQIQRSVQIKKPRSLRSSRFMENLPLDITAAVNTGCKVTQWGRNSNKMAVYFFLMVMLSSSIMLSFTPQRLTSTLESELSDLALVTTSAFLQQKGGKRKRKVHSYL